KDLLTQGVERGLAEAAVARALSSEGVDEAAIARAAAERRARQLASLPPAVRRRRLWAFLARRGFTGTATRALIEELCR
ncbi:MAG TPA: RecX family transcriptional regulator, partial [Gemmatimonadales bacterium]|nr:RecX family transcriptional regulator [Gemmatimonadales bacterium]